eukprot:CAMPEP_0196585776 /NCGR_PEP_ID=MMETSP1081-20130531/51959_1 /TAXON_ID=36882 /ORGANISM="Pyramimonas amylifera, Strain CCMP720" /LENGTH=165 /DNA_ID=CAMNT_0041907441 /DNA_START=81 /DNA_END=579 /DNA_ORIENTATION=-
MEEHDHEAVHAHVRLLFLEMKGLKEENSYLRKALTHQATEISEFRSQLEGHYGQSHEQFRRIQDQISYVTGTMNSRLPESSRTHFAPLRTQFGKRTRLETDAIGTHIGTFECLKCGVNPPQANVLQVVSMCGLVVETKMYTVVFATLSADEVLQLFLKQSWINEF